MTARRRPQFSPVTRVEWEEVNDSGETLSIERYVEDHPSWPDALVLLIYDAEGDGTAISLDDGVRRSLHRYLSHLDRIEIAYRAAREEQP